ncbi:MAG: hypothetical protein AB1941_10060 [Gemmatimonadota bacterium]
MSYQKSATTFVWCDAPGCRAAWCTSNRFGAFLTQASATEKVKAQGWLVRMEPNPNRDNIDRREKVRRHYCPTCRVGIDAAAAAVRGGAR